jgi:hypothetical protein
MTFLEDYFESLAAGSQSLESRLSTPHERVARDN